jgi:dipeptidyl aminopeptidase/acylaminoacyl peptidase
MTATPFDDLDDYLGLPRVAGLAVSADGSRLVTTVAELNATRTEFVTAIWELDPTGQQARRLTRGAKGESSPAFTAEGDLLFVSVRPTDDDDKPPASVWRLPAAGGEAVEVAKLPGGVSTVRTARAAAVVAVSGAMLPSARSVEDDRRLRDLRKDTKVSAILHTGYPVRYWDKDLGPDEQHLFRMSDDGTLTDVTPYPGVGLREPDFAVSADGGFAIAAWRVAGPGASMRSVLMRIDLHTCERSVIADDADADLEHPLIAPAGSAVAFTRETVSTPLKAPRITVCCLRFGAEADAEPVELAGGWDRWPASVTWTADGSALIVTADQAGRCPVFRIDLDGTVTQLTSDDYAYTDVVAAPGGVVYALRSSSAAPPHPVRIDGPGKVTALPCVNLPALPGTLTEISTPADAGTHVRSWLVLPRDEQPAPLLLWIHGGPLGSWNSWSWRWNPWLLAARGYAVLLPDPALSTGYGQDFIQRGWGAWGGPPFDDVMAATDAACADPRIDATRTAAMGGSYGGYLANWVAGHTDRFNAIVAHASLWALDQFGPTTDGAYYWLREMTPQMAADNSPHRFVAQINTPLLVIHGDKDYRVPIGEALRLWFELLTESGLPAEPDGTTKHRFLYFPSENHWVLSPQHTKIWYQVVAAFLAEHVLGEDVELPDALG